MLQLLNSEENVKMCDFQGKSNIKATLPHVPYIHPLQYIVNTLLSLKVFFPPVEAYLFPHTNAQSMCSD